jgi:hypothetical protein
MRIYTGGATGSEGRISSPAHHGLLPFWKKIVLNFLSFWRKSIWFFSILKENVTNSLHFKDDIYHTFSGLGENASQTLSDSTKFCTIFLNSLWFEGGKFSNIKKKSTMIYLLENMSLAKRQAIIHWWLLHPIYNKVLAEK